jgi:hypothetical protein
MPSEKRRFMPRYNPAIRHAVDHPYDEGLRVAIFFGWKIQSVFMG